MHVFLPVNLETQRRINGASNDEPLWFAAPIYIALEKNIVVNRSLVSYFKHSLFGGRSREFLVFNIGYKELLLRFVPSFRIRWISLHQWRPDEFLGYWRRAAKKLVLSRSKLILTYSRIDEAMLLTIYPEKKIKWIGHFVDTDFFHAVSTNYFKDKYVLCVGDHMRLEATIGFLADKLDMSVIRVTRDISVKKTYFDMGSNKVTVLNDVSFTELRKLYSNCEFVLNAVDDRYWPVGITSFCEALSMNKKIVTSGNHSCSGYYSLNGTTPYLKVSNIFDKSEWLHKCDAALRHQIHCEESPRDLAIRLSSLKSMSEQWRNAVNAL